MRLKLSNLPKQGEPDKAAEKEALLKIISKNLTVKTLRIIAEKSKLPGINTIIQQNQNSI